MATSLEQFTRSNVLRIVGITAGQLSYWERLELVEPQTEAREKIYSFGDLIRLRTVKQVIGQRVAAGRLSVALRAFRQQGPAELEVALTELRFIRQGRRVAVEYQGSCIEPISGQLLLEFDAGRPEAKVCPMPERTLGVERSLEDCLALALECEADPSLRPQAIDAYRKLADKAPGWLEPRLNLGTLYYESGRWAEAAAEFRLATEMAPGNPLAHFNLGSVLDELGEPDSAALQLEEALRLAPGFADAHYNLARIYEKLGAVANARAHWRRYLELDDSSEWSHYARERLEELSRGPVPISPIGAPS